LRLLHTCINVTNLDRSIKFYTENLGLQLRARREIKETNAEIAHMAVPDGSGELELTWWRDKKDYSEGDQLDHIAFAVEDMDGAMKNYKERGIIIAREPYKLSGGTSRIAFIKDPDGIWIELIETAKASASY
jgi:lactoylglutathione lyase